MRTVWCEEWRERGFLHRLDGPAIVVYNDDGSVSRMAWYRNGLRIKAPERKMGLRRGVSSVKLPSP